ncbi:MAG: hypothetical protein KGZ30_01705 [Anaplasmataceae bacterium]|nr:hypothetical protein [Anaplasmataceae bacterium]
MVPNILSPLLNHLTDRQRQVIVGRFALEEKDQSLTLAAIGNKYDITRERVRQIEAQSIVNLREVLSRHGKLEELIESAVNHIEKKGGVSSLNDLAAALKEDMDGMLPHHLPFLASVSGQFSFYPEDTIFHRFFYLDSKSLNQTKETIKRLTKFLESHKRELLQGNGKKVVGEFVKAEKLGDQFVEQCISVSKVFHTNAFGDFGLAVWPEIKPTTIRERIYLVISKSQNPLHFREIAQLINKYGLSKRPALVPTVHNELIKDKRFVLVGRGIYALGEQGYVPGTAKEVIARVLNNQGALDPEKIVLAVQKERLFKPNTILANLQNKRHFERLSDGRYRVREA